jgi:magnesium transporter
MLACLSADGSNEQVERPLGLCLHESGISCGAHFAAQIQEKRMRRGLLSDDRMASASSGEQHSAWNDPTACRTSSGADLRQACPPGDDRIRDRPMDSVVNCIAYAADGRRVGDVEIDDISEILRFPGQFIWIGLHEPTEELVHRIQAEFGLHDLAIEDALRAHQRPKIEEYGSSLFVVLRTAQMEDGRVAIGETHVFVGPQYVISLRHGASLPYTPVRTRCEASPHLLRKGPGFVLYALMDFVVDNYFPVVDALEEKLESLEERIFGDGFDRESTGEIYELKRDLVGLKRAVAPLIEVCNRLVRFDAGLIPEDTRVYFRDIYDHVIRINETVDNLRELLTTALEANLSLISVAQNDVTKKLAAWAAILAVPTAIAGVYGMNFAVMPELQWRYGYPLVMAAMASVCGLLYWRFKRADWL